MSEKNVETLIHNFLDAYMKLDVDRTLSFFAENTVWQVPKGRRTLTLSLHLLSLSNNYTLYYTHRQTYRQTEARANQLVN